MEEWTNVEETCYEGEEEDPTGKYYCETCFGKGDHLVTSQKRKWYKQHHPAPKSFPSLVWDQEMKDAILDTEEPIDKRALKARRLSLAYMAFAKELVLTDDPRWDELDEEAVKEGR